METYYVKIINPKAKSILNGLVNLNLIQIQKAEPTNKFSELLKKFRKDSGSLLSFDEITNEVDAVREKEVIESK